MNENILEVLNITRSTKGKDILENVSLNIKKGSVCGLLGKNGSGKSTLIKCCLGLIRVQKGNIALFDEDPWKLKESTKEKIAYVPQSPVFYPWLKVREMADYTASFYKAWDKQLVEQLMKDWELDAQQRVANLSEGQIQKLAIILALAYRPEFLIFDEPVASLDPAARREFLKTILSMVSDQECTVFISSHITSDLERIINEVAILDKGSICYKDDLDSLKEKVKKIRLIASQPLLSNIDLPGVLRYESFGHQAQAVVNGFSPELKKSIEQKYNVQVEVFDLNLEDIFLEVTK